jgi:hypothetical protein
MHSSISAYACTDKAISEYDIGKMPQLFYGIFVRPSGKNILIHSAEDKRRMNILTRQSETTLNEALKYARSKELRQDIYNSLRTRATTRHNESVIIREVMGLCSFAKDLFDYCKVTIRMHLDK